jgi:uncharacterized circularly permuted ATP-grasp superfamily protein/uncharacterized alpha-E superfamily protein
MAVSSPPAVSSSVFASFFCPPGGYCEAFQAQGRPRPHWQPIIDAFGSIEATMLAHRQNRVERMRHEDGTTYNPFDDPKERAITWSLDMLPLPLTAEEWEGLENGVQQRATLLERILADVYGPQELLNQGKLPAEMIFNNPAFLHACHNIRPSGDRYLTYYAVDVYRGSDGRFRVLRDFGGQPTGLGYALENRIVISRVMPELYHQTQIRRLAPFFQIFHRAFLERVEARRDDPTIVLLSPGPDSRVYFEHALLSRYLGYPLVEGEDLTVRNGRVYQKKLAGLEPVEAIFRQVSDGNSDPFALRREKANGVAGLLQAAREKNIDIVNPIGTGFVDTPLLPLFLPQLSQLLLGCDLLLETHPIWWCGTQEGLRHVLANLDQLRIRSALDRHTHVGPLPSDELQKMITQAPNNWLGRERLQPSSAPVWANGSVVPHYCIMRLFACATKNGFQVMPGGLALTATDPKTLAVDWPERQQSKDIWVLSDHPVEPFSMMSALQSVPEFRRSSDLPSRVADNLLWLGRYLERAEGQIRLLRSVFRRLSGEARPEDIPELEFLINLLQASAILPVTELSEKPADIDSLLNKLQDALYNKQQPGSVFSTLQQVQTVARNVRDRLSLDCWRVINHLDEFIGTPYTDPLEMLEDTLFTLSSFSGLAMESMTRGLGWRFMDMGRRVERAMNQVNLIRIGLQEICANPYTALEALLEIGDSIMTYRGRYRTTFQLALVLDLLIMDETNPKSLAFQFSQLAEHVEQLPRHNDRRFGTIEERLALEMLAGVRLLDLTEIHCRENGDSQGPLLEFLDSAERLLNKFGQQITAHYLSRVPTTPHYSVFLAELDE